MQFLRDRLRDWRTWAVLGVAALAIGAAVLTLTRPSSSFAVATATLSVISGQVDVVTDASAPRPAVDGEALATRTTVRPQSPDGRAVLTFRDGSTVELEPAASVRIEQLSVGTRGELVVILHQDSGRTWSYVQPQLSANSRFHIRAPSATVVVRGTKFEVEVDETAPTGAAALRVSVFEGLADLVVRGRVVPIPPGHGAEIVDGTAPAAARRLAPEGVCMRFEVSSEALITVTDPYGRSAGQTPNGALSQIPWTVVTGPQDDPQAIEVFSPAVGRWEIGIVPRDDGGPLQLFVYTAVDGQLVDRGTLTMSIDRFQRVVTGVELGPDGRSGSFESPVESTATRAVALPSDSTTTAPLALARLFQPREDAFALACIRGDELQRPSDVKPVGSPGRTAGR